MAAGGPQGGSGKACSRKGTEGALAGEWDEQSQRVVTEAGSGRGSAAPPSAQQDQGGGGPGQGGPLLFVPFPRSYLDVAVTSGSLFCL